MRSVDYQQRVAGGVFNQRGRPLGHEPKNKGFRLTRGEVKSNVPAVKDLFDIIDADGRSVRVLADNVGYSPEAFSNWRRGKTTMDIFAFSAVAISMGYKVKLEKCDA